MEVFEIAMILLYGCRPKSISLLGFLWDMIGCGGIAKVMETEPGSAQESKIKVIRQLQKIYACQGLEALILWPISPIYDESYITTPN